MAQGKGGEAVGGRGEPVRGRVIDAAERLLAQGRAAFSMRDLAAEAGVSFATPFNHFGSKAAIMHALSDRRIDAMHARFAEIAPPSDALSRVLMAVDTAAAVMLEKPEVNRAVMSWIGTAGPAPGRALARSTSLWASALGTGEGLREARREEALRQAPRQLALAFRGALSFWTAGEIDDAELGPAARALARVLLAAYASRAAKLRRSRRRGRSRPRAPVFTSVAGPPAAEAGAAGAAGLPVRNVAASPPILARLTPKVRAVATAAELRRAAAWP